MKQDWVDARFPGTDSVAVTLDKLSDRAKRTKKGDWIFVACVSASENKFTERRLPSKAELDHAAPDNPVILGNGTHMAIVNSHGYTSLMAITPHSATSTSIRPAGGARWSPRRTTRTPSPTWPTPTTASPCCTVRDMTGIYLGNVEPFTAMEAMVTRGSDDGTFEPQEAISVEDAVRMWTIWPAKAIGEAEHRGSIEVGKLADMTVLTEDVMTIAPDTIHTVTAAQTIVGGRTVFTRD